MNIFKWWKWCPAERSVRLRLKSVNEDHARCVRRFPTVIGRGDQADLKTNDGFVSQVHCLLDYVNGSFVVQDLESRNGTLVNGTPVDRTVIGEGDTIDIGMTRLTVESLRDDDRRSGVEEAGASRPRLPD